MTDGHDKTTDDLTRALILMCDQYLKSDSPHDTWDDMAMTAGEEATEMLCKLGYAHWAGGRTTIPNREAIATLEPLA